MCVSFSFSTLCVLFATAPAFAADPFTLAGEWNVDFGRGQERVHYLTAACPDGTFYLADDTGRVAVIDSGGKVASRQLRREFAFARALTCDAESHLYIAHQKQVVVMQGATMIHRL